MALILEDLDDMQFERLTVECMRKLFGSGVKSFAPGPDGGRDAMFNGTAERFPSEAEPWTGVTIGQAKHTMATNSHFSDPDFSGGKDDAVLEKEKKRVKKLVKSNEIDCYFLMTNRRQGGVVGPKLEKDFSEATGLARDRVFFAGSEFVNDLIHRYPDLPELAKIDPIDGPLLVSSWEIAEVILAISEELDTSVAAPSSPVDRVSFENKNKLNSMSEEFADKLKKNYLRYSLQIEQFLAEPGNEEALANYENAVEDFQLTIIAKRKDFQSFDDVFNHLFTTLASRDGVLGRNRRLLRTMLFYMYWHCDIGKVPDASTQ